MDRYPAIPRGEEEIPPTPDWLWPAIVGGMFAILGLCVVLWFVMAASIGSGLSCPTPGDAKITVVDATGEMVEVCVPASQVHFHGTDDPVEYQ